MNWTYKKDIGLHSSNSEIKLTFGSERQALRSALKYDETKNKGRSASEDSYGNSLPDNWFRLSFDNNKLSEIEILGGSVLVDGVPIILRSNLQETLKHLTDKGYIFKKGDYSLTDFKNLIDIGDSELNGGDPNQVVWFYTATDFEHFKD